MSGVKQAEGEMLYFRNFLRHGLTCFGDAKRLTKGYPDGEFIELAGDRYDEV